MITEYQKTTSSTEIYPIYDPIEMDYYTHLTATISDLTKIINAGFYLKTEILILKLAHEMGLKVMVKPHIDIESSGSRQGPWRGDIYVTGENINK